MRTRMLLSASALALLVATPAWAQQATTKDTPAGKPAVVTVDKAPAAPAAVTVKTPDRAAAAMTEQKPGTIDAQKLIGRNIHNPQGDTIGEVESVILDKSGKVTAVVVGVGGFLGMGQREVAIDWDELRMENNGERVTVDMTKDQLKALPEFKYAEDRERGRVIERDRMAADRRLDRPLTATDARTQQLQPPPAGTRQEMRAATADRAPAVTADRERAEKKVKITGIRADDLLGQNVVNQNGDTIGEIDSLVLDDSGRVQHVIVGLGGFLGIGDREVMIEWKDIKLSPDRDRVITSMTEAQLKALPEVDFVDRDRDRAVAADARRDTLRERRDMTAAAPGRVATRADVKPMPLGQMRADDLIGKDVVNARGETIGEIEDLVLDKKKVVYAVIGVGGFLGMGEREVAVPFEQLQLGRDNVILMSEATKETLKDMPEWKRTQDWSPLDRDRPVVNR